MKEFTVDSITTGEILRTGQCQDTDFEYQAREGESITEGLCDANLAYIVHGDNKAIAKAAKPGINYDWDYETKAWVENVAAAKELIKQQIKR